MTSPFQPAGVAPGEIRPVRGGLLVVGFGNTLRQDDGVGPFVAAQVEALCLPGVATLAAPLLSPEHAEAVSGARLVVFVDAAQGGAGEVCLRPLAAAASSQLTTHAAEPATLLALARDLYGRAPEAYLLTIPADGLGFGEGFSERAALGAETALAEVTSLLLSRL
jgi:hydrogenase maturation protease